MGRKRSEHQLDPATGKELPPGVRYRGKSQYWARKVVNGGRVSRTFATAKLASDWLKTVEVDKRRGVYIDPTEAERQTLSSLIDRYITEVLGEDSEKRGAEKEVNHLRMVQVDRACQIKMSRLTSADLAETRNRMKKGKRATHQRQSCVG